MPIWNGIIVTGRNPGIAVDAPFTTRRKDGLGLSFPPVYDWASFVFEACTMRAVIKQELMGPDDWKLLCLELLGRWYSQDLPGSPQSYQEQL
jgi:hypothetical protein